MPTPEEDRALLADHKRAVRANAPHDAEYAARLVRRLVDDVCPYAGIDVPQEVQAAALELEAFAINVRRLVEE
jgi:hypothetical protein